jgi:hypothetical protein
MASKNNYNGHGSRFKQWNAERDDHCNCRWCGGRHWTVGTTDCSWKSGGPPMTDDEAVCQKNRPQTLGGWQPNEYKEVAVKAPDIWTPPKEAPPGGCNCRKCNMKNEFAAPNQKDGSYVCYTCR